MRAHDNQVRPLFLNGGNDFIRREPEFYGVIAGYAASANFSGQFFKPHLLRLFRVARYRIDLQTHHLRVGFKAGQFGGRFNNVQQMQPGTAQTRFRFRRLQQSARGVAEINGGDYRAHGFTIG